MKNILWITVSLFWLMACKNDRSSNQTTTATPDRPVISVIAPEFNADSAYYFVDKQVEFGPRVPNTQAHRECGDYLINTLKTYGAEVTVQDFVAEAYNGTKLQSRNIIASYFPQATKRILLAAHWDTRHVADKDAVDQNKPIDGANDGGSGVGVLLEIARVLKADTLKPNVGIDIIFFDAEDYGEPETAKPEELPNRGNNKVYWCLGSQYWAANKHKPNYSAYYGILLDMVGAKGSTFAKEGTSMENAPSVVEKVWNIAQALGHGGIFINQASGSITDDHVFVNRIAKINMIDIIDYDSSGDDYFGSYHHTHADNMLIIDKATLKAVGQTVLQTLYEEGNNEAI